MEVTVAEYRNGNDAENSVHKITGLNKATDVTFKRGVIGSAQPLHVARRDPQRRRERRCATPCASRLMSEDHRDTVATWELMRARIIKYVSGPFNAKGTDVAMEELTLAYERMEMEDAV